jgi:hypothetical protein
MAGLSLLRICAQFPLHLYIRKAKTPTLILRGEDDDTNPVGQAQALYRALIKTWRGDAVSCLPRRNSSPATREAPNRRAGANGRLVRSTFEII